jgi:iron complex transport system substrate-binding protein
MLASWCGKAFKRDEVEARDGWQAISAIKSGRIHEIAAAEILQPGPACLTAGLRAIEKALDNKSRV